MKLFEGYTLTTGWIAAITRGHNAGVCLMKDGEIVFCIEEERLSRQKYDGGPFASMVKIKEYTDKIDYLLIAHTQPISTAGRVDFSGEDIYTGLARKLHLIDHKVNPRNHPQVIDLSQIHHKLHASCAFYRSGFDEAVAVVVDGCGTFFPLQVGNDENIWAFETESIIECSYPNNLITRLKFYGTSDKLPATYYNEIDSSNILENDCTHAAWLHDRAGIVKVYEAVTQYCGFTAIEAGKTMGLFPYGKYDENIPKLFDDQTVVPLSNRNLIIPTYPNAAIVNSDIYKSLYNHDSEDKTKLENRRNLAYACQIETQQQVADLIRYAVNLTNKKQVVVSGGYGLNCVANYYYLDCLKDEDIEIYVEPVSNDAGTAMGAALLFWNEITNASNNTLIDTLYYGPAYKYDITEIQEKVNLVNGVVEDASYEKIINIIKDKNIVAIFQGKSENGPRALGNRSILFDPTFEDGKNFVNNVKKREYFRPFAGTILEEHVHEWFDLRGMKDSPFMMYAVNCKPGMAEKIPSIIHVDGTCRIQTVNSRQNYHFYELIKEFYKQTSIPILFNTSFNLGGEPLVETLDDAINTLNNSDIEYLYLPEYSKLIIIKNK